MNLFNLENNSDTPVDLGDVGEEKGYKCCVCNRKGSGRDFPPAENEKAICPECLDKRKKSGNTIPEEFVNKVFNEDCFEFIKRIPDNSISLCVVDPPFGVEFRCTIFGKSKLINGLETFFRKELINKIDVNRKDLVTN